MSESISMQVHHHFEAAHHLPLVDGKCSKVHGHRWEVEIEITPGSPRALHKGMLVDFHDVIAVVDELDHTNLNDLIPLPTAELIAIRIANRIAELLDDNYYWMVTVGLWESPDCSITYSRDVGRFPGEVPSA